MDFTDVICVGQAVLDCITRGQEDAPYKPNVYRAQSITLSTGGDAVNESFVLASLKRHVRLICGLGDDPAGRLIISEARRRGVDTSRVLVRNDLSTPVANIMTRMDGSRSSVNSTATMLNGYTPDPASLRGAKIVSFASLFRAPLDRPEVVRELLSTAKMSGALVCADTKLPTFRSIRFEDLTEVLPLIDYIFPNEKEAAFYTGKNEIPEMARALRGYGIRNVIIKTGPEGCYMDGEDGTFSLPALDVPVFDTTGAGDNFTAGFYDALLDGASFRECGERGIRQAAKSLAHPGAV